jgi:hypothetical protein
MATTTGARNPHCMACGVATVCAYHAGELGEIREADAQPARDSFRTRLSALVQRLHDIGQITDHNKATRAMRETLAELDDLARANTDQLTGDIKARERGHRPEDFPPPVRESRDVVADLGIPADELDRTPTVEDLRARSRCLAGSERDLAAMSIARRNLARHVSLQPSTGPARVREATTQPDPPRRSIAKDLGLAEDELVPVEQLREASGRRAALVDRWRELDLLPPSEATALDLSDSLHELAALGRLVA